MLFPILQVHPLPKLHVFWILFFLLYVSFHMVVICTVTISRNSLVLYRALFCFIFFKILRTQKCWCHSFLAISVFIFSWNRIVYTDMIYHFSWHLLLWCFLFLSFFGAAFLVCIAWPGNPCRPLQHSLSGHFFWRLVSWRFLVCVNSENIVRVFFLNFLLHYRFQWCCLQGLCKSMFVSLGLSFSVMLLVQTPKVFLSDIHVQILIDSFLDNALISQRCSILSGLFFGWLSFPATHVAVSSSLSFVEPRGFRTFSLESQQCPAVICFELLIYFLGTKFIPNEPLFVGF